MIFILLGFYFYLFILLFIDLNSIWLIQGEKKRDFTKLEFKLDHANRPLWACADDFLISIAEPVGRYQILSITHHFFLLCTEYQNYMGLYLSDYSSVVCELWFIGPSQCMSTTWPLKPTYAAESVGLETETIIAVLNKMSKNKAA